MQSNGFGSLIVLVPVVLVWLATASVPKLSAVLAALSSILK